MVQSLFPNFLNDLNEYHQAETLWRERWDELVRRVGQERQWVTPWLTTTFADGTPFADGNPIFSAVSHDRRLGVRVIQVDRSEEPQDLSVWTDTFAEGEPEAIKELVITCALTSQTVGDCLALMERWITKEEVGSPEENALGSSADAKNSDAPQAVRNRRLVQIRDQSGDVPVIDGSLLMQYMAKFFGYGDITAPYWFIGIEEGGDGTEENITTRLDLWHKWNQPDLVDLVDFYKARKGSERPYFSDPVQLQDTWEKLIWLLLAIDGKSVTEANAKRYQKEVLGRKGAGNCLMELLPLPCRSMKPRDWHYGEYAYSIPLPHLVRRKNYEKYWKIRRAEALRQKFANCNPKPKVVVLCGSRQTPWSIIANGDIAPGEIVRQSQTFFSCIYHPSAHEATDEDYLEMGRRLHNLVHEKAQ